LKLLTFEAVHGCCMLISWRLACCSYSEYTRECVKELMRERVNVRESDVSVTETAPHVPVMLEETLAALGDVAGAWCVDGTFGAGGHSRALLAAGAQVLALDRDARAQTIAQDVKHQYGQQFRFVRANFADLAEVVTREGIVLHGVLLDLGVSSMQLDEAARGFAFRHEGPLDMRMGLNDTSAETLVNTASQADLAALIYKYGEDRYSRRIARAIVTARQDAPITTTSHLAEVVASAYPRVNRHDHPARRTFQALRIVVNGELDALETALASSAAVLAPAGRMVILSYHSLEDRIVKGFMRQGKQQGLLEPLSKKPLTASETEIAANPRARSAKLRAAQKLAIDLTIDNNKAIDNNEKEAQS
jgi:16S rRNA (cytosine1402-N4)-methyltransferase